MLFNEIPGQQDIKQKLTRTVSEGRISHAQLFYGPEGCGKLALAIAYAQYISCNNRTDIDSCGICPSCIKYNKYIHPDLHFVYPTGGSQKAVGSEKSEVEEEVKESPHETWRQALLENPYMDQFQWYEKIGIENKQGLIGTKESSEIIRKLMLKSYEADYKVLIMWLPERMNAYSGNKLLKLIEEPPPYTLFLLVSESPGNVLPTILSRTQMIKIPKLKGEDIRQGLLTKEDLSPEAIEDAVRLSDGNYNRALAFIKPEDNHKQSFERFVALMRSCYARSVSDILKWVEEVSGLGRERQKLLLVYSMRMLRENFLMNLGRNEILHLAGYEDAWSQKFSKFINHDNVGGIYEELNRAYNHISANGYARIVLLDMGLNIVKLFGK